MKAKKMKFKLEKNLDFNKYSEIFKGSLLYKE